MNQKRNGGMIDNQFVESNSTENFLDLYRTMLTIREFEETVRKLHLSGKAPGLIHLYSGQEAVATGACAVIEKEDFIASHHRGHGHCIAKGSELHLLLAEITGRRGGYGMGRGGSMHILDPKVNNLGTNGIVGGSVPLATGAALSAKIQGTDRVAVCFFGDGVLNQGILFESMNMAAIWSLPVIYICEDNRYGEFTESSTVTAGENYTDRAAAFGIPAEEVDGMDVLAVGAAVQKAVDRARAGKGPGFLVCETYRFTGHHISDNQDYKEDEEREMWEKRDPIPNFASWLTEQEHANQEDIEEIDKEVVKLVQSAAKTVAEMAHVTDQDLMEHVYAS
jgi:pyruvate dehydrogenase E1 component alpha subunit